MKRNADSSPPLVFPTEHFLYDTNDKTSFLYIGV